MKPGPLFIPILLLSSCARQAPGPAATLIVEEHSSAIRNNRLIEPVGFETLGGVLTPVLQPCGTPCEKIEVFSTATENQSQIELTVLRGRGHLASQSRLLGTFLIQSIPPQPQGVPQIAVTLRADDANLVLLVRDRGGARLTLTRSEPRLLPSQ